MAKPYEGRIPDFTPGVEVEIGPYVFTIPPLLFRDLKRTVKEKIFAKVQGALGTLFVNTPEEEKAFDEGCDALVTIMMRSLKRNYPELTEEKFLDFFDVSKAEEYFPTILNINNLVNARPTMPPAPGNGGAAAILTQSTSTPTLSGAM